MLQINYLDAQTRDFATKEEHANEMLGPSAAIALRTLISDAEAAHDAQEFVDVRGTHVHRGDSLMIEFGVGFIAVFKPIGHDRPGEDGNAERWKGIKTLMLMEIRS